MPIQDYLGGKGRMPTDLDGDVPPLGIEDMEGVVIYVRQGLLPLQVMLTANVPHRRRRAAHENQKQALSDSRPCQVFLRKLVLALSNRTIHNRNALGLGPRAKATAETAGQAHQMRVVQRFVRPGQRPPPQTKATWIMPHAKVGIQHDPVYAIVAAGQQVRIPIAQRVSHVSQLNTPTPGGILASGFLDS